MLDSINVGVSGLLGYQQGLRVIANNTANLNTPGYKGSTLQFADLLHGGSASESHRARTGSGLDTRGTYLNFNQGDLRQTGNDLDLALDGDGMFTLRNEQGEIRYTRAGQFQFDGEGKLVNRAGGERVLGVGADGKLGDLTLTGLQNSPGKATSLVRFTGNLSSTQAEHVIGNVKAFDALGGEHLLTLKFTSKGVEAPGAWKVELFDGTTSVATSEIVFSDGRPTASTARWDVSYSPAGSAPQSLKLDFSADATSFASGGLSSLAASSQDGHSAGNLSGVEIDAAGSLVASYTNGQSVKGTRLALGRFSTPDAVEAAGGNLFKAVGGAAWQQGVAGEAGFGAVRAGMLEMSNVDLSREFSDLVVMQRGYQASSQVISTANDMLQELFGMKRR